jgi:multisubunit Na+/H+ antiporter MnhC subunit
MVITGLVVAFAATALALVLTLRLHQTTGAVTLAEDPAPPANPGTLPE